MNVADCNFSASPTDLSGITLLSDYRNNMFYFAGSDGTALLESNFNYFSESRTSKHLTRLK